MTITDSMESVIVIARSIVYDEAISFLYDEIASSAYSNSAFSQ